MNDRSDAAYRQRAQQGLKTAMKLTGHRTRSVFRRYDILTEDDLRDGVSKLAVAAMGTKKGNNILD